MPEGHFVTGGRRARTDGLCVTLPVVPTAARLNYPPRQALARAGAAWGACKPTMSRLNSAPLEPVPRSGRLPPAVASADEVRTD